MDSELLIPIFWTVVFGSLLLVGVKRLSKKKPTGKTWTRPETKDDDISEE
tara:strand:+ start:189 stop:338 length:150 start_codon:yes stop_codon:yes gene_type:complete